MNRGWISSAGSLVFAFLATQHHNLHVLMLTLGIGTAGAAFLATPGVRYAFYALSLVALGVTAHQLRRHWHSRALRIGGISSAVLTVALLAWSAVGFGA